MQQMKFEIGSDGVATLTWDMPGRTMNVLSEESLAEFAECVARIKSDETIKGAVITSGKETFLAGADLMLVQATVTGNPGHSHEQRLEALYASPITGFGGISSPPPRAVPLMAAATGLPQVSSARRMPPKPVIGLA